MLAGPSGSGNGSKEREPESVSQPPTPQNHTIQLRLTTDHPDKPISRKITYDTLPAWRNLCSRIEKLFGINFDAVQVIYPLDDGSEIIVKGDHDLHAVLGSQPIAEQHIFKFIVRNMHSPRKTGNKIIGRPIHTHNRPSTPKKFQMDTLRITALDTDVPPRVNDEPPPDMMNSKKYRLFPLNGVYNEDYLRKRADRYTNPVPLGGVPLQTPSIMSHIDWPKETPERITVPAAQPSEIGQRPVQAQPVRSSIPAPVLEPVQGLALDLGPPASGFIAPSSTLEEPSELHMGYNSNNNNNNTPRPPIQIFPIPHPRTIPPPPPNYSSIPELVPASMFPQIILNNSRNAEATSLGLGHNLPIGLGMMHHSMPFSPQQPSQLRQGDADRSVLNPPPGFIPTGRQPHPPSPMERIIDDTSDFTNPTMLLSPLRLRGEEDQTNANNRLRRRSGEIVVIEDTSASSPNSVRGGDGVESLLSRNNGIRGGSAASSSPPLGSAAIQRYLDADSDCSSGERDNQRPKARIHTPPISSSRTRPPDPEPSPPKPTKTSSQRHTGTTKPTPAEPSYESSSSTASWLIQKRKKKSVRVKKKITRSRGSTLASTHLQSNMKALSKPGVDLLSAPAPPRPVNPVPPSSSTSTKRINSFFSDHTAGLNPSTATSSATFLPVPPTRMVPQDSKIEDVVRVQIKELMRGAIGELKAEMQNTMAEMRNEIRERLGTTTPQVDPRRFAAIEELKNELQRIMAGIFRAYPGYTDNRLSQPKSEESRESQETFAASLSAYPPHRPPPPPPPSDLPPPPPSSSIPQPNPPLSAAAPLPHSYHPYMSLPTSTFIFPPHHPYCSDYTLPTPTFTVPYHSYMIPPTTGLPSYHPGACCHVHHARNMPMESSYCHHPIPPPPPPPPPSHVQPPPAPSAPQQPYFFRQGRWYTPDTQTPGGVGAAPAYSGNNLNASSSLPPPSVGNDMDRMRNEYNEGLARIHDIEERFKAMLAGLGAGNDKPYVGEKQKQKLEDSTSSVPALTSADKTNPEPARRKESVGASVQSSDGGSQQRTAWENLMSYVSKPGRTWPKGD